MQDIIFESRLQRQSSMTDTERPFPCPWENCNKVSACQVTRSVGADLYRLLAGEVI